MCHLHLDCLHSSVFLNVQVICKMKMYVEFQVIVLYGSYLQNGQ